MIQPIRSIQQIQRSSNSNGLHSVQPRSDPNDSNGQQQQRIINSNELNSIKSRSWKLIYEPEQDF